MLGQLFKPCTPHHASSEFQLFEVPHSTTQVEKADTSLISEAHTHALLAAHTNNNN
jgi:hypothetical protein